MPKKQKPTKPTLPPPPPPPPTDPLPPSDPLPPITLPPPSGYGPQAVGLPSGVVPITPGSDIQAAVNGYPTGTAFGLLAGIHQPRSVMPKSGNTFVFEYGAVIDGTGWTTTDETAAAFHGYGGMGIVDVTIRNAEIRNMPKKGIYAVESCTGWTLENCEVHDNKQWGIVLGSGLTVRNNILRDNGQVIGGQGGNYSFYLTVQRPGVNLVEHNEIARGGEQKAINSAAITWRDNWFHHNLGSGLWNDGEGNGSLIEGNLFEDNVAQGLHWELSYGGTIRNNTFRRNGDQGLYISTSRDTEVYGNTFEANFRGILLYLTCAALGQGWSWNPDLANLNIHDNVIVSSQSGAISAGLAFSGECDATARATYLSGAKNIRFSHNAYRVPNLTSPWWLWEGWKTWAQWQAIQDADGSATVG